MKKMIGVMCIAALAAGLASYAPCWAGGSQQDQGAMNSGTGGAAGGSASSDANVQQSTGGAAGGSSGQDVNALKKEMNNRLKAVDKEISAAKKSAGNMTADQKDAMQLQIDQVQAKRDAVKKMIGDMKRVEDQSTVETAMADLEQSAKGLSASTQRSTPAGDSKSGDSSSGQSGGATGGAAGLSLNAIKQNFTDRIDKVSRDLDEVKKNVGQMDGSQKDMMQLELDRVMGKLDAAKRIVANMKDISEQQDVEKVVSDLEQSVQKLMTETKRSPSAGDSKSGGASSGSQSKGGATGGSAAGTSQDQSTGGAAGGAAGQSVSLNAMKTNFNDRIDKASRDLNNVKKNIKDMQGAGKNKARIGYEQAVGQRDAAKKMVADLKRPEHSSIVENAVTELEQSVSGLSSETKRSTSAGDAQSGGTTGGSSQSSTGTAVNQSTGAAAGGVTGGSAGPGKMMFSYDQRNQHRKTASTKLDSFTRRIDMLKENAKLAPQDVNSNVMPKVDELSKKSDDIKKKIGKIEQTERQAWNTTRTEINSNLDKLELSLMEAEKDIS